MMHIVICLKGALHVFDEFDWLTSDIDVDNNNF